MTERNGTVYLGLHFTRPDLTKYFNKFNFHSLHRNIFSGRRRSKCQVIRDSFFLKGRHPGIFA